MFIDDQMLEQITEDMEEVTDLNTKAIGLLIKIREQYLTVDGTEIGNEIDDFLLLVFGKPWKEIKEML